MQEPSTAPPDASAPAKVLVWRAFASPAGGFEVLLPGPPREESKMVASSVEMHVVEVEQDRGRVVYAVAYTDFAAPPATNNPEKMLDRAREALLFASGGSLVFERRLELHGVLGREVRVESAGRLTVARLYAVRGRLVEASVVMPEASFSEEDAAHFLDSLRLN